MNPNVVECISIMLNKDQGRWVSLSRGVPPGMRITQKDHAKGVELDFSEEEEHWNTYELSDETKLKIKL